MELSESEHPPERSAAATGSLHDGRQATVSAVGGAVPKITVERFFEHVLPPLHARLQGRVDDIWDELVKKSAYDTEAQEWTAFQEVAGGNENTTFSALVVVAHAIEAAAKKRVKPLPEQVLKFSNDPDRVPESVWRTATNKPDGYFTLCKPQRPGGLKAHWIDIGPTGEYKLKSRTADVNDNLEKLLWNMSQSVKDDARRKFTFAFTIEGHDVRLWYGGRAEYVASDTFDFMKEPKRLVEFFLKFFYAPIELSGWDTTMRPVWEGPNGDQLQYIITVRSTDGSREKTYKTISLLSSIAAEALRGRGTRVWLAEPCDAAGHPSGEPQVVIKDCWIDQGLECEGDIIRTILEDAQKMIPQKSTKGQGKQREQDAADETLSQDEYDLLANSLLTPEIHGDVFWTDARGAKIYDRTLDRAKVYPGGTPYYYIFDKGLNESTAKRLTQLQDELKGEHRSVWQHLGSHNEPIEYNPKAHYRIVFTDVCRTLRDETLLEDILMHLGNTCLALKVLHKVGWVHRDISAGNILLHEENGFNVVKLADFEYSKNTKKAAGKKHDIRTGTLDFMAGEVHATSYMFLTSSQRSDRKTPRGVQPMQRAKGYVDSPIVAEAPVPWSYNPIHDFESVWWLTAFFTLNKDVILLSKSDSKKLEDGYQLHMQTRNGEKSIPAEDTISRATRVAAQTKAMRDLFHHSTKRQPTFASGLATLHLRLHPALEAAGMIGFLDAIRRTLVTKYQDAEAALSKTSPLIGPAPDLCDDIMDLLESACGNLNKLSAHVAISDLARAAALSRNVSRRQVTGDVEQATSGFALMNIAEAPDVQLGATANDTDNGTTNVLVEADAPATEDPTPSAPVSDPPASKRRQRMQVAPSTRRLRSEEHRAQQPPPPVVEAPPTTHDNTAGAANRPRRTSSRPSGSGSTARQPAAQMEAGHSRDGPSSGAKPAASTRTTSRKNPTKSSQKESGQAATRLKGNGGSGKGRGRGTKGGNKK